MTREREDERGRVENNKKIFDFGDLEKSEEIIRKTWDEFREALSKEIFNYDEVEKAKEQTFLRVYDDLFNKHLGIELQTKTVSEIRHTKIGRGTILEPGETPDFERFIPKEEYIKEDNRFSPPGVEWLYMALGNEDELLDCAQYECRVAKGDRFGFCHFNYSNTYDDCKIVDLTISDELSFGELNLQLEEYGQEVMRKIKNEALTTGKINDVNRDEFETTFTKWGVYTYTKLLSDQIFIPLDSTDNKKNKYAPFQTIAHYFISLGYSGIIYGSTVCPNGKNIVLFDKKMAKPYGNIDEIIID